MKSVEAQLNSALDEIEAYKRIVASLKHALHETQIKVAATERANILREAMLPASSIVPT